MDNITILGVVAIYLIFIVAQHLINWLVRSANRENFDPSFITVILQIIWIALFYAFTRTLIELY